MEYHQQFIAHIELVLNKDVLRENFPYLEIIKNIPAAEAPTSHFLYLTIINHTTSTYTKS